MQAGNRLEILIDAIIGQFGPNPIDSNQLRALRIARRRFHRIRRQAVLQSTGYQA
jgi:hypothetical protein